MLCVIDVLFLPNGYLTLEQYRCLQFRTIKVYQNAKVVVDYIASLPALTCLDSIQT